MNAPETLRGFAMLTLANIAVAKGDTAAMPLLTDLCSTMKSGSLCALGGFTPYPVLSALNHFPDDFQPMREAAE